MSQVSAASRSSAWIISPGWDLACIIATPLAIVPLVHYLASGPFTAAQISLFVLAFASIGHHLPGFLRAYGEPELFARFRWRFLLAPPLVLCLALAFAWLQMRGLQLVLLLWATWHILMQTYGCVRIYGLKRGETERSAAQLDWLLCLAIFVAGYVFSDNRMFTLVDVLWQSGVPTFGPGVLLALRWVVGIAAGMIAAVYLVDLGRRIPTGRWCPAKLLLLISTAAFYWISGAVTTDLLLGVAMFEIFHAVQYFAVTWAYQQRRRDRAAENAGSPLTNVSRYAHFIAYATLILGFGGLRYALGTPVDAALLKLVTAVYAASAILHFYYDGFIWKVSERPTQANLNIATRTTSATTARSPLLPGAKWAAVAGAAVILLLLGFGPAANSRREVAAQLARMFPSVPEAQERAHHEALAAGDAAAGIAAARQEVALRPQSEQAHANLGTALLADRQYAAAAAALQEANRLDANVWQNYFDLAQCFAAQERWNDAAQAFAQAAALDPKNARIQAAWGAMCARSGDTAGAVEHCRRALALAPQATQGRVNLAAASLQHGQARQQAGDFKEASANYRECLEWSPNSAAAYLKLGEVLYEQNELDTAAESYARVIELDPAQAAAYYNLGLIKWQRGETAEARKLILRARELGTEPSPQVIGALQL